MDSSALQPSAEKLEANLLMPLLMPFHLSISLSGKLEVILPWTNDPKARDGPPIKLEVTLPSPDSG